jgi:hypothetical protein
MRQTMPEGVTVEVLDALTDEMDVRRDPPAGLVVHVHYEEGGRAYVIDVWESAQAYEAFAQERLGPAMERVAQRHGVAAPADGGGTPDVREVHGIVRGR